jgi:hypothetical protein
MANYCRAVTKSPRGTKLKQQILEILNNCFTTTPGF